MGLVPITLQSGLLDEVTEVAQICRPLRPLENPCVSLWR